jgi:hypothetical protein
MKRPIFPAVLALALLPLPAPGQGPDPKTLQPSGAWPTYNGDYSGRRYSALAANTWSSAPATRSAHSNW